MNDPKIIELIRTGRNDSAPDQPDCMSNWAGKGAKGRPRLYRGSSVISNSRSGTGRGSSEIMRKEY